MSVYASVNDTVARRQKDLEETERQSAASPVPDAPASIAPARPAPDGAVAVAEPSAPPTSARGQALEAQDLPSNALAVITKNIPTEVIGGYLAVLALIPAQNNKVAQWVVFWFFWMMTPVVVWLGVALKQGHIDSTPAKWPLWPMLAATVAFTAWAAVIPNSAIGYLSWFQPYMGAVAIALLAILLPVGDGISKLKRKPSG
jgi:hypothetical protein